MEPKMVPRCLRFRFDISLHTSYICVKGSIMCLWLRQMKSSTFMLMEGLDAALEQTINELRMNVLRK